MPKMHECLTCGEFHPDNEFYSCEEKTEMSSEAKHTPGAMRAAKEIQKDNNDLGEAKEWKINLNAQIIDTETGLGELLEAAKETVEDYEERLEIYPNTKLKLNYVRVIELLRAAIARAEGKEADHD